MHVEKNWLLCLAFQTIYLFEQGFSQVLQFAIPSISSGAIQLNQTILQPTLTELTGNQQAQASHYLSKQFNLLPLKSEDHIGWLCIVLLFFPVTTDFFFGTCTLLQYSVGTINLNASCLAFLIVCCLLSIIRPNQSLNVRFCIAVLLLMNVISIHQSFSLHGKLVIIF